MSDDKLASNWHKAIFMDAEAKLERPLRDYERHFIESRGGYVALEMIHDSIRTATSVELEEYFGSEHH